MESHGLVQYTLVEGQGEARPQWESRLDDGPGLEQHPLEKGQEKPQPQWAHHLEEGHGNQLL